MAIAITKVEIVGKTSKYERSMRDMKRINSKLTNDMKKSWMAVGTVMAGVFALSKIKNMMTGWAQAAGVQQEAVAGFHQALVSMGRYTPEFEKQMIGVASSIQRVTTMGDEAAIEGMKFLSTYKNIGNEVMPETARVMADLATMMRGDVRSAANLLGKASMGLSGELRRVGITIDETIAKSGDFSAILKEIKKQIGGQAEALAKTGIGPWKQLANLMSDTEEAMGFFVLAGTKHLLPFLTDWAEGVKVIANWMTKLTEGPSALDILQKQAQAMATQLSTMRAELKDSSWMSFMYGDPGQLEKQIAMKEKQLSLIQATIRRELAQKKPPVIGGVPTAEGAAIAIGGDITKADQKRLDEMNEYYYQRSLTHEGRMLASKVEYMTLWHTQQAEAIIAQKDWEHQAGYDHEQRMLGLKEGVAEQEYQITKNLIDRENALQKQRREMAHAGLNQMLGDYAYTFAEMGKHSQTAFEISKAFSIAQTVIKTYEAAMGAYAAMVGVPIIGPALAVAAAAAATAAGMAQVSAIASTSPGTTSVSGGAVGTYPASPVTGLPVSTIGQTETKGAVHIHIEGDFIGDEAFVDRLVEKINDAADREVFVN